MSADRSRKIYYGICEILVEGLPQKEIAKKMGKGQISSLKMRKFKILSETLEKEGVPLTYMTELIENFYLKK